MSSPSQPTPLAAYHALVAAGTISPDHAQEAAAQALDDLWHRLMAERGLRAKLARLFTRRPAASSGGLYLHGGVGRGKSMLMDSFYETVPERRKRRVHFHAFMQEVHQRIHDVRQRQKKGQAKAGDPIPPVAQAIARQTKILCFDEFQVKDIADASILGRLFTALFDAGVWVVATSNRHPHDLYAGGLHRDRFLPFIALLTERLSVFELSGETDYRLDRLLGHPTWFTPVGRHSREALDQRFADMTGGAAPISATVHLMGREWVLPMTAMGVARLRFETLCAENRGAPDYLALARQFHTVVIDAIPALSPEKRNEAIRFITLIDTLYEHRVKLIASADAEPQGLYPSGDSAFEFQRTVSRLNEMQSREYMALPHRPSGEETEPDLG